MLRDCYSKAAAKSHILFVCFFYTNQALPPPNSSPTSSPIDFAEQEACPCPIASCTVLCQSSRWHRPIFSPTVQPAQPLVSPPDPNSPLLPTSQAQAISAQPKLPRPTLLSDSVWSQSAARDIPATDLSPSTGSATNQVHRISQ
ncbi:hypothetical protein TIFTF001_050861 [Ficus carica]|uniref:Uncharacterized protein n=1 Tax=Ficus carica TaxID=3494 RepID=A0AA88CUH0_FICCA|nr:hypothetical protein TIFTF001_050861 [Ficus carica]